MSQQGYVVAVVGATRALGREVRAVLHERRLPIREWRLFDTAEQVVRSDGGESEGAFLALDALELDDVEIVFLCMACPDPVRRRLEDAAGRVVLIDLSQTQVERVEVPLVVPEVNAAAVADWKESGIVGSPVPGAIALSVALKPLDDAAGLRRVVVAAYEPVSSVGEEGIEELARQSRDLLSGCSVDTAVFPHRIAFNLIPQVGDFLGAAKARGEWQIESQTRRVLALDDLPITVTAVRVPVFYGQGYAVNVETEQALDAAAALALLHRSPGIVVLDDVATQTYPTLIEVMEADATFVGRLRDDPTVPCGLNLWLAIDGVRKGGAVNAVQIAELLIRDHL
jgi:aspartate-semialdehyde dehydrogenase